MLLEGIFPAITTPFYPDGRVYYKKLEHNVDRYSKTPLAGLVVLGSTGEAVMLSESEQGEVLKLGAQVAAPDKVLIAGVGCESAHQTLQLAEVAAQAGYDCVLVRTPHFYRPQMKPENLLGFYRVVADRSPLPVVLYTVPVFTAYDLPVDVIAALAEHPNIIGLKESSGNLEKIRAIAARTREIKRAVKVTEVFAAVTGRMLTPVKTAVKNNTAVKSNDELVALPGMPAAPGRDPKSFGGSSGIAVETKPAAKIKTRTKEVSFQILTGQAQTLAASLEMGASGGVLAFAAAAPTACFEIYAAWKEGDKELAREKQSRISAAAAKIVGEFGIPGVKYSLDLNGYYGGPPRLPLLPASGEMKAEIERLMADIRN